MSHELVNETPFEICGTYLSDVSTNLTHSGQKLQCSHPFLRTESCFSSKVMEVCNEALEDVGKTKIWTLRIDADGIFGDVIDGQVLHWRHLGI